MKTEYPKNIKIKESKSKKGQSVNQIDIPDYERIEGHDIYVGTKITSKTR